jgi:AcrR family transcriptional regulator
MQEGTKKAPRARGRPRAYEPDAALAGAMQAFWRTGFSGASVEQLSDATDMNRPSMYAAFGDKRALYLTTLDRYIAQSNQVIERVLDYDVPLAVALRNFYEHALESYLPSNSPALGCYLLGTAATEAVSDAEVRKKLGDALREFHRAVDARFRHAQKQGEIGDGADPGALATMASAALHSLAIRARAGNSRASLEGLIEVAVAMLAPKRSASKNTKNAQRTK